MAEVASRTQHLRDRHEWFDHLMRAGGCYTERHGNEYAAAVTYFSVLSLVTVTMVAFAAAGFALGARPAAVQRLQRQVAPGAASASSGHPGHDLGLASLPHAPTMDLPEQDWTATDRRRPRRRGGADGASL